MGRSPIELAFAYAKAMVLFYYIIFCGVGRAGKLQKKKEIPEGISLVSVHHSHGKLGWHCQYGPQHNLLHRDNDGVRRLAQ